jgi:phosphoglycerate dehydrogenase-like enzyme
MHPSAHLINVGRGPTVVEPELAEALADAALDGAALDVFEREPLPADSPLWCLPGVVVSAHMAGDVIGWRDVLARQFVANAERWLAGEPLENVVDTALGYVPAGRS